MQTKEAEKLRRAWGNKPCDHTNLDKEYYLGSATGDYVCVTCGKSDVGSSWNQQEGPDEAK